MSEIILTVGKHGDSVATPENTSGIVFAEGTTEINGVDYDNSRFDLLLHTSEVMGKQATLAIWREQFAEDRFNGIILQMVNNGFEVVLSKRVVPQSVRGLYLQMLDKKLHSGIKDLDSEIDELFS